MAGIGLPSLLHAAARTRMEGGENEQVDDDRRNVLKHGERNRPQQHPILGLEQLHAHLVLRDARAMKGGVRVVRFGVEHVTREAWV